MEFRESVSYSKDLINGRSFEVTKNKPIAVPAKGVFTVQLFDSITGKKTYEAKSENRISAVFANASYLNGYFHRIIYNEDTDHLYSSFGGNGPCNVLALTDGDIPEDPYDYFMWGNVIGYCDLWRSYAGSDTKRGNRNINESTVTDNYIKGNSGVVKSTTRHWVVDFPTSSGNGTFRSIYLTGYGSKDGDHSYPRYNWLYDRIWFKKGDSNNGSIVTRSLTTDDNYFYALKSETDNIQWWDKRTGEALGEKTLSFTAKSICYDRWTKSFWTVNVDGVFKKLDKDFNVVQSFNVNTGVDKVDGTTITSNRRFYDICVTESYILQTFYVYTSSLKKTAIAVYNKDGTFVKTITIDSKEYRNATIFEIPNNKLMVVSSSVYIVFNKADLSIYSNDHSGSNPWQWASGSEYCRWDFDLNVVCRYASSNYGFLGMSWVVPAGAHTLLPEPVTKTPTNTMKIQYDITVDYVYPLDMPPH